MPFQCCMGSKSQDKTIENKECTIKKIPKPIDLNEGYNTQLEFLIFNNTQKSNKTCHGFNSINKDIRKLSYHPIHYFNTSPVTFVETKVSNLVNTLDGPAVTQASSNVILSGCNSPIKLVTSIEAPPGTNVLGYTDTLALGTNKKVYQSHKNSSVNEEMISKANCFNEEKINDVEINHFLDDSNISDKEAIPANDRCSLSAQIVEKSQDIKNHEDQLEGESDEMQKCTNIHTKQCDKIWFDEIIEKKNEMCNISGIKNDIDELIVLSKLKNENKYVEKKRKKTKKAIHIEISFSPNNNVFVDAQHNQNEINKSEVKPLSKIGLELTNLNELNYPHNKNLSEKDTNKGIHPGSTYINSNKFSDEFYGAINKPDVSNERVVNKKFNESDEPDLNSMTEENKSLKEGVSNDQKNASCNSHFEDINEGVKNKLDICYSNHLKEKANAGIHSFENLIPFIDEPEIETGSSNIKKHEDFKYLQQKESSQSLTDIKQPNSDVIELSQETLEKLNGSLPIVESDPQMAKLFASAQVRIEDIDDQNRSFDNNKCFEECDPFDLIIKFLDCPSKYKDLISWATIKAIKEVYEPQAECARKELDRWMSGENISDESKDNIEYYNSLASELQEKLTLAEKARELLMAEYKYDDIQSMLLSEQNSLEEIKKRISQESVVLKSLEEQYLNGCVTLKENVRASRIRIKDLENDLKGKLAEIHKLEDLLKIHENSEVF